MQLRDDFVAVRVPATSANLGPGFDCLGLALKLYDTVTVRATTGGTRVEVEGEGAGDVGGGEDNLVVRALRYGLDRAGAPQVGIRMRCENRIPEGRGLGSSASAIVAGLMLARALIGDEEALRPEQVLQLATDMEGHPDNAAPTVYGGATVAWMEEERAYALPLGSPAGLGAAVFVPGYEVSTAAARETLPRSVPRRDAVFNVGRAALLTALLAGVGRPGGSPERGGDLHRELMAATADRLHQDYRRSHMPSALALVDWLRRADVAAVVSGAGPSVLALEPVAVRVIEDARRAGWRVLEPGVDRAGAAITRGRLAEPV